MLRLKIRDRSRLEAGLREGFREGFKANLSQLVDMVDVLPG
jgi:hypothetical protein